MFWFLWFWEVFLRRLSPLVQTHLRSIVRPPCMTPWRHDKFMNLKPFCTVGQEFEVDCRWHYLRPKYNSPFLSFSFHLCAFFPFSFWHFSFLSNLCAFFFSVFALLHSSGFCWLQSLSDCHGSHLFALHLSDFQLGSRSGHHGWKKFQTYHSLDLTFSPLFQLRTASRWKNVGAEKFGEQAQDSLKLYCFTALLQISNEMPLMLANYLQIWYF